MGSDYDQILRLCERGHLLLQEKILTLRTIFAFGNALELPAFCMIAFCKLPANILNIHISLEDNILFGECNL